MLHWVAFLGDNVQPLLILAIPVATQSVMNVPKCCRIRLPLAYVNANCFQGIDRTLLAVRLLFATFSDSITLLQPLRSSPLIYYDIKY